MSAPTKVGSGTTMTYAMTLSNAGTGSATGVVVSNAPARDGAGGCTHDFKGR